MHFGEGCLCGIQRAVLILSLWSIWLISDDVDLDCLVKLFCKIEFHVRSSATNKNLKITSASWECLLPLPEGSPPTHQGNINDTVMPVGSGWAFSRRQWVFPTGVAFSWQWGCIHLEEIHRKKQARLNCFLEGSLRATAPWETMWARSTSNCEMWPCTSA